LSRDVTALAGLRVVEVGGGVAAAFCGKLLADLGAEVLKVEPPGGDRLRDHGPFVRDEPDRDGSGLFLYLNENKLGATIDLDREDGWGDLVRLCASADVLIESFPPGELALRGVDPQELRRLRPSLVVVSITPFGQSGPYAKRRAGELEIFHAAGLGFETPFNQVEDPEHEPPLKAAGHQALCVTGWTAALGALAALRDGNGAWLDVSAFEAATNTIRPNYAFAAHEPEDGSNRARLTARRVWGLPWIYRCADGWVSLAVIADAHWQALKRMMGSPEWAASPLFASAKDRYQNSDALRPALADWISTRPRDWLHREGQERHVPVFPVHTIGELFDDPHLRARRFFRDIERDGRRLVFPGYPFKLSSTPCERRRAAPVCGADDRAEWFSHAEPKSSDGPRPRLDRRPLEGVRILDMGWVVAVPFACAWLGALGAEVVRLESRARLDPARFLAIPPGAPRGADSSPYFTNVNFSKRSITLNLDRAEGRELVNRLVPFFDVVVENFSPGRLEAWGFGYDALQKLRRDVILVSASTLGQSGPEARSVGWGPNTQAYAGLCSLTGYENGPPCGIGGTWPDFTAAAAIAFVVMAALRHRDRTGEGQAVDLSLAELILSMLPEAVIDFSMNQREAPRRGNRDPKFALHDVYRCRGADEWIALSAETDRELEVLASALGLGEMPAAGVGRGVALALRDRDAREVAEVLVREGVRAAKVMNTEEILGDPHFVARSPRVTIPHPVLGARSILGLPIGGLPYRYAPAPLLGADNAAILGGWLGLTSVEIQRLSDERVIF
jgi:crotonobetainyl-CoA:carnitine CoA-transferase CaiB-like acyl-CoA transferase